MPARTVVRLVALILLTGATASCGGCTGKNEQAFCEAVQSGDAATARTLLAGDGFNIWARDARGECQPLRVVFDEAEPGQPAFTALAMALLETPGVATTTWVIPNSSRGGTSGTGSPLIAATANDNLPLVEAILARGADVMDTQGRHAFTDAAMRGHADLVRALVEGGGDPSWVIGTAVNGRRLDLVSYLESKGAREDRPALLVAARTGDLAAVDAAIAQQADLEVRDGLGLTPIMRAAKFDQPQVVTRLARAGADVNHMTDGDDHQQGLTALHLAAEYGSAATIAALVAAKANLEARRSDGWPTPLLWAVAQGSSAGVHALVAAGARGHVFKTGDQPALAQAVRHGRLAMVRDLLGAGARPNERIGEGWQPPLHVALTHCGKLQDGSGSDADFHVDLLRVLVEAGADRSAPDADGLTPLDAAAKRLAEATHPYYQQCFQAKVEYLRSL